MACPGEGCPPRSRIVRVQNEPHRPQNLLKRGRRVDAHLRLWGRNQGTWYLRRKLRCVSHHIRKIACVRGRSPGLYAANFPDLSRSAVLLAADMLDPIAQKPNRGCTDRLGRPLCEVIQAVAFCRTSVMMSSEERGAVVAWHRRKRLSGPMRAFSVIAISYHRPRRGKAQCEP